MVYTYKENLKQQASVFLTICPLESLDDYPNVTSKQSIEAWERRFISTVTFTVNIDKPFVNIFIPCDRFILLPDKKIVNMRFLHFLAKI